MGFAGGGAGAVAWEVWFVLWPLLMLLAFAMVPLVPVVGIRTFVLVVRRKQPWGICTLAGLACTAVHVGFLFWLLGTCFPDA